MNIQEYHNLTIQALTPLCEIRVGKFTQENRYYIGVLYKGMKVVFDTTVNASNLCNTSIHEYNSKGNRWTFLCNLDRHEQVIRENIHKWVQEDLDKIYSRER